MKWLLFDFNLMIWQLHELEGLCGIGDNVKRNF